MFKTIKKFRPLFEIIPQIFFIIYASQLLPPMPHIIEKIIDHPLINFAIVYLYLWLTHKSLFRRFHYIGPVIVSTTIVVLIYLIRWYFGKEEFNNTVFYPDGPYGKPTKFLKKTWSGCGLDSSICEIMICV